MKWPIVVVAGLLAACSLEVRYTGTQFTCELDGRCPSGFVCNADERCVPLDGEPPDLDAAPADASGEVDAGGGPDAPPAAAICGDGVVEGSEECDDQNAVVTDACVACKFAFCGDGFVRADVEACDGEGCNSACVVCGHGEAQLFREANGHCYWLESSSTQNWWDAEYECAVRGGHPVTYSDLAESDEVFAELLSGLGSLAWIGLRSTSPGGWAWSTGEPLAFEAWGADEPSGDGDCGRQNSTSALWHSEPCDTTFEPYLCEDDGWSLRPEDNHAYRVVHEWLGGTAAASKCAELGGRLVSFESDAERLFVAQMVFATGRYWQESEVDGLCQAVTFDTDGPPYSVSTGSCSTQRPFVCEVDD